MSEVTVSTEELDTLAARQDQAAAEAGNGVGATASVNLNSVLYETHGPISGPSNDAITAKTQERQEAGQAIQQACLALAQTLTTAAANYTGTDQGYGANLNSQMRT
jgi:hypothetical protein